MGIEPMIFSLARRCFTTLLRPRICNYSAEGEGFEPPWHLSAPAVFPGRSFQPLTHPSKFVLHFM